MSADHVPGCILRVYVIKSFNPHKNTMRQVVVELLLLLLLLLLFSFDR